LIQAIKIVLQDTPKLLDQMNLHLKNCSDCLPPTFNFYQSFL